MEDQDPQQLCLNSSKEGSEDDDLEIIEADTQPATDSSNVSEDNIRLATNSRKRKWQQCSTVISSKLEEEEESENEEEEMLLSSNQKQAESGFDGSASGTDIQAEGRTRMERFLDAFSVTASLLILLFLVFLLAHRAYYPCNAEAGKELLSRAPAGDAMTVEGWVDLARPEDDDILATSYKVIKKEKSTTQPVCQNVKIESWHAAGQRTVNISYMVPLVVMENIWLPRNISGEIVELRDGEGARRMPVATDFPSHVYVWKNVISLDVEKAYQQKGPVKHSTVIELHANNSVTSKATLDVFKVTCTIPDHLIVNAHRLVHRPDEEEEPRSAVCLRRELFKEAAFGCSRLEKHLYALIERVQAWPWEMIVWVALPHLIIPIIFWALDSYYERARNDEVIQHYLSD